jgi:Restriction endonuclease
MDAWIGPVSLVVGVLAGSLGTTFTTRNRLRLEHHIGYDRDLRGLRLPHSQRLHHVSECIPQEWRPGQELTRLDLVKLWENFHNWYLGEDAGGPFLTPKARAKYWLPQNELQSLANRPHDGGSPSLTPDESARLRTPGSDLRHQLRQVLGSADPLQLLWTDGGPTPAAPQERVQRTRRLQPDGSDEETRFHGHAPAQLVGEILQAEGFFTQVSPAGPDGGVDILAGQGSMGFDGSRLAVQVKSGDQQVDAPTCGTFRA